MGLFKRKKQIEDTNLYISSPIHGDVLPIEQTPDSLFANKGLGDGVMIKPHEGSLYSPCDGVIEALFPTKHAIGLRMQDGSALLIHFGLETAKLKGKGFEVYVKTGMKVKKGKLLMEVDLDYIKKYADDDCVIMVISELKGDRLMDFAYGYHTSGSTIITIKEV